ncbi:hypothetical protein FRX31_021833 [Thalictrum thalictroides]|uniref:Uncharacterized protein n=1 Tax=Thalictrum thalictroides TaxID=46969 RepID=A0A7J6VU20_THATH|nr:hypothetical protein FRX31_021833 [Thalictrum thalictroides]
MVMHFARGIEVSWRLLLSLTQIAKQQSSPQESSLCLSDKQMKWSRFSNAHILLIIALAAQPLHADVSICQSRGKSRLDLGITYSRSFVLISGCNW